MYFFLVRTERLQIQLAAERHELGQVACRNVPRADAVDAADRRVVPADSGKGLGQQGFFNCLQIFQRTATMSGSCDDDDSENNVYYWKRVKAVHANTVTKIK